MAPSRSTLPARRFLNTAATARWSEASLEAAAAGLDLICRGIRLICQNDQEALERGAVMYDALYAQLSAEAVGEQCGDVLS